MPQPSRSDRPDQARAQRLQRRAPRHRALWPTLLLGTALASPSANAATATPEQAHSVERELSDWFRSLAGGLPTPGDYSVRVQPHNDDYALTAPLSPDVAITGHLAPQDDGRWRLVGLALPSPATYTDSTPVPSHDGQPAATLTRTVEFSVAQQATSGILDPSYATPSSVQQHFEAYQLGVTTGDVLLSVQLARAANETTLTPVAGKRVDTAYESALDGVLLDQRRIGGRAFHVIVDHGHVTTAFTALSRDRGPTFFRALAALVADRAGKRPLDIAAPHVKVSAGQRAEARIILDTLDDLASGAQADAEMSGVQIQTGTSHASGVTAVMRRLRASAGARAEGGMLTTFLDLGTEGMSFPGLHAAAYADLIPTHVHLRPTLAGIGTQDLIAYARQLLDAADQGQPAPSPAPLLTHGSVVAGLDALSFNIGPTLFDGHGTMTVTAPGEVAGEGQVTATYLDELIDRAKQDPAAQTLLSMLTFAKGIGHESGSHIVWNITYQAGKVLVNGVDLMARAGPIRLAPSSPKPQPN